MRLSGLVLVDRYTRGFTLTGESFIERFVERFGGYDTPAALAAQQQKATGTDDAAPRLAHPWRDQLDDTPNDWTTLTRARPILESKRLWGMV